MKLSKLFSLIALLGIVVGIMCFTSSHEDSLTSFDQIVQKVVVENGSEPFIPYENASFEVSKHFISEYFALDFYGEYPLIIYLASKAGHSSLIVHGGRDPPQVNSKKTCNVTPEASLI